MFSLQILVCRAVLAAVCISGCAFSLLCARADYLSRQNTAGRAAAAVRLVPFNTLYIRQLAEWLPSRKIELLKQALAFNRFDAESWIQLGLHAEIQKKDVSLAERYFLNAAEVNQMYLPRWTLTNFYFRQQNESQLFSWARRALQIAPHDATPIFVSLWLADPDPTRIAAVIPPREQVILQYASFLAQTNRLDLAQSVMNRAIALSPSRPPLSEFSRTVLDTHSSAILDRLLQVNRVPQAIQLWGRLVAAKWIPHFSVPSANRPLTNGDFKVPFFGHGFDWQLSPAAGLTVDQFSDLGRVRFTFSGAQPEACLLIQQIVPLEQGRRYRLTWAADSDQIGPGNGITWSLYTVRDGSPVPTALSSSDLTSLGDSPGIWEFQAPNSSDPFLIALQYARPLGKVRIEGSLSLRNVALQSI